MPSRAGSTTDPSSTDSDEVTSGRFGPQYPTDSYGLLDESAGTSTTGPTSAAASGVAASGVAVSGVVASGEVASGVAASGVVVSGVVVSGVVASGAPPPTTSAGA